MTKIRPQYHFRRTRHGLDAWDVRRLVRLSSNLPVQMIRPADIAELHQNHWFDSEENLPTPQKIIEHLRLIEACDLSFPIILDQDGRVMDGMHRICKAVIENVTEIPAVRFREDPLPDHVNCQPDSLPYES